MRYPKKSENKFILQIEQISEKIIRLKQIDSIHFYVMDTTRSGQSECTFVFSKNLEFLMELIKIMNPIREPASTNWTHHYKNILPLPKINSIFISGNFENVC